MAWRREDTAYAAAALAAAAVVVYFVIANFGLVPSPLTAGRPQAGGALAVPNLGAPGPEASSTPAPRAPVAAPPVPTTPVRPPSAAPSTGPAADRTPPTAHITTADGSQVSVTAPATVDGTAADAASGVASVTVTFTRGSGGGSTTAAAQTHCTASRRSCTWSVKPPAIAGQYTVSATATDRADNKSPASTISLTVVDGGNVVTTVTDVVNGLLGL
jgi:hypothetical protein